MQGPTTRPTTSAAPAPQRPLTILLVAPDDAHAKLVTAPLDAHFGAPCVERVSRVADLAEADLSQFGAALCAASLPDGTGLDVLRVLSGIRADLPVIILADEHDLPAAMGAVQAGAADVLMLSPGAHAALPLMLEKNLALARVKAENRRLQEALNDSIGALRAKNEDLERAVASLQAMALTDELTGLANRRRLADRLGQMYAQAVRYGSDLACIMIDLDGFKTINDTLGHQRGDELLVLAGKIIAGSVRSSDVAARYGGDEFVILLPHTTWSTAATLATRLSSKYQRDASKMGRVGLRCGMSIGIACLGLSAPADGHQLLAQSDNALYSAKQAGKSRIMVCGPDGVTALAPEALHAETGTAASTGPVRFG